jgi:hypothetical protein
MSAMKLTAVLSALTLTLSSVAVPAQTMKKHHHHHCHPHAHCHHHKAYKGEGAYVTPHHVAKHHAQYHQYHQYHDYVASQQYTPPTYTPSPEPAYKGEYKDAQVAPINPVYIPETTHRFEVTFDPMLLKPGASNLNYVIYNNELPVQSPKWYEQELKPKYNFAFELAGKYMFPQSRYLSLDWTHMKSTNTSSSVAAPSASYFLGPDYQIGPAGTAVRTSSGSVDFYYDVVNLNAGQAVSLGNNVTIHLFAGISDGMLREELKSTYSGNNTAPFAGTFTLNQDIMSSFFGLGPRFGLDGGFTSDCGLGFYGEAAGSALIGSMRSHTGFLNNSSQLVDIFGQINNAQLITDQNTVQVVPGFDAKLGLTYKHVVGNNVMLSIGAGYQAAVYMNAISEYVPGRLVTGEPLQTGGIFVDTMSHRLSNYTVQGPYLNFSVKF